MAGEEEKTIVERVCDQVECAIELVVEEPVSNEFIKALLAKVREKLIGYGVNPEMVASFLTWLEALRHRGLSRQLFWFALQRALERSVWIMALWMIGRMGALFAGGAEAQEAGGADEGDEGAEDVQANDAGDNHQADAEHVAPEADAEHVAPGQQQLAIEAPPAAQMVDAEAQTDPVAKEEATSSRGKRKRKDTGFEDTQSTDSDLEDEMEGGSKGANKRRRD